LEASLAGGGGGGGAEQAAKIKHEAIIKKRINRHSPGWIAAVKDGTMLV
jgi:hypothetical protein